MRISLFVVMGSAVLGACEFSNTQESRLHFVSAMSGAKEKPTAVTSAATGEASLVLSSKGTLSYTVSWTGLSGAVTGAHIHGPADTNNTSGVLVDFSALPPGSSGGSLTLAATGSASGVLNVSDGATITATVTGDSLVKLLGSGLLYVNVHTAANTNGEIRGQIQRP